MSTSGKTKDQVTQERYAADLERRKKDPEFREAYWRDIAGELFDQYALHLFVLFGDGDCYRMADIPLIGYGHIATVYEFELQAMLLAFEEKGYANTYYESGDGLEKLYVLHKNSKEIHTRGIVEWVSKRVPTI